MASRKWWIATLLFLATAINYLDRQTLSVTAPLLRQQFHLTASDYSRVVACFLAAYTIAQVLAGGLMDRAGPRKGLSLSMTWWSLAGAAHSLAAGAVSFGALRFLLGAGEAGNWPGSVKTVQRWFPESEQAFAIGFFNSGSALGAIVALPLVTWITIQWSWRAAFVATGAAGMLWLIPWLAVYRSEKLARPGGQKTAPARAVLRDPAAWSIAIARFFADPVWWFYVFWLPDYLAHARHLPLQAVGAVGWAPFLAAGIGSLTGGWASGALVRRHMAAPRARFAVMAVSVVLMSAGASAAVVPDLDSALALISLATFAYSCWAANVLTLPADLVPAGAVGTTVGLCGTVAGVGGTLTTLAVGALIDRFGYGAAFCLPAALPLLALIPVIWIVFRRQADAGE